MLTVFFDEYRNGNRHLYHEKPFKSLQEIADYFFSMMRVNYTGADNYAVSLPRERNGVYPKEPTIIQFHPSVDDPVFSIRKITDGESIVYSDGTYTCGQKFWTDEVREWCRQCEERRKNPSFNFADKAAVKPHKIASSDPARAEREQNVYVVCYRESCVRDVEVCIKDPAEANPVGDEWMPVDSAKLFVGIFRADSDCLAVEAAVKAEGCDKECLEALPVSKQIPQLFPARPPLLCPDPVHPLLCPDPLQPLLCPDPARLQFPPVAGRLYHVYKKDTDKHKQPANARNIFKKKQPTSDVATYYQGLSYVMDIHAESGVQAEEAVANKLGLDKDTLVAIPKHFKEEHV